MQNVIASATAEIRILTEQIATDTKDLERLGQTAKAHTNTEVLDTELDPLRAKLATVGIAVTPAKLDPRGWRCKNPNRTEPATVKRTRFQD